MFVIPHAAPFFPPFSSISVSTERAEWKDPDFSRCVLLTSLPNLFEDLDNITVTPGNNSCDDYYLSLLTEYSFFFLLMTHMYF